jgi:hypothetical protein
VEVDLAFGRLRMGLRHVAVLGRPAGLGGDLRSALAHVVAHRRVRQIARAVLVHQPRQDAPGGVALLFGAFRSLRNMSSMKPLNGASRGDVWAAVLRGGGIALANPCRTVRRCT